MFKPTLICYVPIIIISFFLSIIPCIASEDTITVGLNITHKASYITCCDLEGNGLKDIIVADDYNITILKQNRNYSFEAYTIKSKDKITGLNSCRLSKSTKEDIMCIGTDKLFYFSWDKNNKLAGPNYININEAALIEKQKNIKNFQFITDINNDKLDDIIIPSRNGLLCLWQIEPKVFKSAIVQVGDTNSYSSLNISPWPKVGDKSKAIDKGFSFFPTFSKVQNYWLQDYNNDHLVDIVSINKYSDTYIITVLLQNKNQTFQEPRNIILKNYNYLQNYDSDFRLLDLNHDGLLDIIETKIEYPLNGNNSIFPLLVIKIYFATNSFQFNRQPNNLFKTAFIPGLDNIVDLNRDGYYEIITAPPPIKFASKESIIKIVSDKEIPFDLNYFIFDTTKNSYIENVNFDKSFSIILRSLAAIDDFKQFITTDDININDAYSIIVLKKTSLLEINILKNNNEHLYVNKTLDIYLPCYFSSIKLVDINSDGIKEILLLDNSDKKIYTLYLKNI